MRFKLLIVWLSDIAVWLLHVVILNFLARQLSITKYGCSLSLRKYLMLNHMSFLLMPYIHEIYQCVWNLLKQMCNYTRKNRHGINKWSIQYHQLSVIHSWPSWTSFQKSFIAFTNTSHLNVLSMHAQQWAYVRPMAFKCPAIWLWFINLFTCLGKQ